MRRQVARGIVVATIVGWGSPGLGQETGYLRGTVIDRTGDGVRNATVVATRFDAANRFETRTAPNGEYVQAGVPPGLYTVTASKGELGGEMFRVRIRGGHSVEVNFVLEPGRRVANWMTEASDRDAVARAFADGVQANRDGRVGDAIDAFRRALDINPTCVECSFNLGVAYTQAERLDDAEMAFKRTLDIQPEYAAAFYGLASLYAQQGRAEDAARAGAEANRIAVNRLSASRARAQDDVARGVASLEAGNVIDALGRLQSAVAVDAGYAPGYYWLGMTQAELGNRDAARNAFRRYLAIAPNGEFASDARERLDGLASR